MDLSGWRIASIRSVRAFNDQDQGTGTALKAAYESLPTPPGTPDAPLAAATWSTAAPNDGVDRISNLPDQILQNIVSRLPAKDAVRTGALAKRWRGFWRATPLVFLDAGLIPQCRKNPTWRPGLEDTLGITNAVSDVLAAHPGPFRCVQITCCHLDLNREKIKEWLQKVASKGIQELAFINRPWPLNLPLTATLFSCTSLTSLHIGAWKFPNTAALPEGAGFPHLKELFLTLITMKDRDLAFLLGNCPVLEVLTIIASQTDVRLCLVSQSLRFLQLGMSSVGDIVVADAPRLERLLLWMTQRRRTGDNKFSRIKIGKAPNLSMLGYWHPGQHQLQIGDTVIEASTNVSPSTIVPSVKILALDVNFDICNEVNSVPSFLKCFPNVDTLHIKSLKTDKPSGKINLKFWQEACPVECVQNVKRLVIYEFQGKKNEHAFLKFMGETVKALEMVIIMICPQSFSLSNCLDAKINPFTTVKWASEKMKMVDFGFPSNFTSWNFRTAVDVSCRDPFYLASSV